MISRREFLQVAAATAAIVPGGRTRAFAQQRLTQDAAAAARRPGRQRHPRSPRRPARPAQAGAVSRAVGQHRRRRRARTIAACHRPGVSRPVQDPGRLRQRLCLHRGGFRGARPNLRQARRARPDRHRAQDDPRRAPGPHPVPRRRRHLAEQLHVLAQQGPGHGRLHGAVEARRHDRPLGVHARRRARQGNRQDARISVSRAEHPRHRMERSRRSSRWRCSNAAASRSR